MTLAGWVIETLRSALPAGVLVYDNAVPDDGVEAQPPERYVVVWMPSPTRGTESVSAQSTDRLTRWQITCVAPTRGMAGWLSERVCDALVDQTPDVDGWSCGPVRHLMSYQPETQDLVLARQAVAVMDRFELLAHDLGESS